MPGTIVAGSLVNNTIDDFSTYRVNADYTMAGTPTRQSSTAAVKGGFQLDLPATGDWEGPLILTAAGPSGTILGRLESDPADDLSDLKLAVAADIDPVVVDATADPALGSVARFTGRVITTAGEPQRSGLVIVLWGVAPSATEAHPVAVAETIGGGYFAGDWPSTVLSEAFARVAGGLAIPVALDGDRLPRRFVLVVDNVPEADADGASPPRAPSAEDLAAQPDAFAGDCGECVDFTIPNRTVEEVTFQAVVRTTQPEIRGSRVRVYPPVPPKIVDRLRDLVVHDGGVIDRNLRLAMAPSGAGGPEFDTDTGATTTRPPDAGPRMTTFQPMAIEGRFTARPVDAEAPTLDLRDRIRVGVDSIESERVATSPWIARAVVEADAPAATAVERAGRMIGDRTVSLELHGSVLEELAREAGPISPTRLFNAQTTSLIREVRSGLMTAMLAPIARFELGPTRQVNWDAPPYPYQATTVAHGHIITMKQVWRADGYSLGDLLYSMALAPGQQKLISLLDWERREATTRTERRTVEEQLSASLSHDRDISDIVRTALQEHMDAQSRATTSAVGGAIGGFIGPVVFGAAGGVSRAGSTANQASSRDVAATALNQARDRTLQAASAVRSQRSTVVQTARQGESVRAQTEAVANNNHCHALTIEYFEVLRHFQVSQELAAVQECLFVPFEINPFTSQKALRWRHVLEHLGANHGGSWHRLRPMFDALARVSDNWANADVPALRYADDDVTTITGEFWVQLSIPKPADLADNTYNAAAWAPYTGLLSLPSRDIWDRYLGVALPEARPAIWDTQIAPPIARRICDRLQVDVVTGSSTAVTIGLDATLVSRFAQDGGLLVSLRSTGPVSGITRAEIARIRIRLTGSALPGGIRMMVRSGSMRYRTDHLAHSLFDDYRILNDLTTTDDIEIGTPLTRFEKTNPRQVDRKNARLLVDILNERVEYYHRVIWLTMDPNRRFMFLDGVLAPDAGGRSVASVVENRVIGVVGNCLVMPVVPGLQLDPTYQFARATDQDLRYLYEADPPPPMRISVPTRGVFAEAVLGKCNSCEKIDETHFWHWDEAPIPDSPTAILPLSTASRRTAPPSVVPSDFPDSIVRYQATPAAPDPTGLGAALNLLGSKDLFRNLTGLALNQENAAAALKGVMTASQSFASQGAALAQQRFLSKSLDRNLDLIKKARDGNQITGDGAQKMTESMFRGALGERRPDSAPVTDSDAIKKAVERVSSSQSGELRLTRPGGSVEVSTGTKVAGQGVDVRVDPPISPIKQKSTLVCWAATGTMMYSWHVEQSTTVEAALDALGGAWRAKYEANDGLSTSELRAFMSALGLREEGPASYSVEGLARMLSSLGPLWVVSDDSFNNNQMVHARIAVGIKGDGTVNGTNVSVVDPATGTEGTEPFATFAARLEATDAVNFGVGIYHW